MKVVDPVTGAWEWKRFADLGAGDMVPLALDQLLGRSNRAALPGLPGATDAAAPPRATLVTPSPMSVPSATTSQLAELAGYFMPRGR